MQEQQAELALENQRIKGSVRFKSSSRPFSGALVEVTSKFEQVVKQMREARTARR